MSRARMLAFLFVGASVVMLLSCGLGAAAVQQGMLEPPVIELELGGVRLISGVSTVPDCARLLTPGCRSLHPEPIISIYTLWLLWKSNPGSQESPHIVQLFSTHIKR